MYVKIVKPVLDRLLALIFVLLFWWLYIIIAILVRVKLGSPVIFRQPRPGKIDRRSGNECIFTLCKFRTMTSECDKEGKLLPDDQRLTDFGKCLRSTSLDEILEIPCNILFAPWDSAMSWVGPRPQLVRDMVFMNDMQRKRHSVRPGITGLAQVKGRNAITWEEKIGWDLKYVENVSFAEDLKVFFWTISAVFHRRGITDGQNATALDYGDELLKNNKVTREQYDSLQALAKRIIEENAG